MIHMQYSACSVNGMSAGEFNSMSSILWKKLLSHCPSLFLRSWPLKSSYFQAGLRGETEREKRILDVIFGCK